MINTYDFMVSHPDYFKQLVVNDMLFLTYKCPQAEKHIRLYTHFNQIGFTLNGKMIIQHRDRSWSLTPNQALFMRSTAYSQEMVYDAQWEVVCFFFKDNILRQIFNEYRTILPHTEKPPAGDMIIDLHVNESVKTFSYGMVPYFAQQPPPSPSVLELKFKELLLSILLIPANAHFLAYVKYISDCSRPILAEIMEANYTFNLTLSEFARICQRSLSAFKRDFTETYHVSPGKWILEKRLGHARYLLETSLKNVNEIAADSGFDSPPHFSRTFKEKYGLPPLQYRKTIKASLQTSHTFQTF